MRIKSSRKRKSFDQQEYDARVKNAFFKGMDELDNFYKFAIDYRPTIIITNGICGYTMDGRYVITECPGPYTIAKFFQMIADDFQLDKKKSKGRRKIFRRKGCRFTDKDFVNAQQSRLRK